MNEARINDIVEIIGQGRFHWLAREFSRETRLRHLPDDLLDLLSSVDATLRDYGSDRAAVTSIALITFAYHMAGKAPHPAHGPNDMFLLKVLAKKEGERRQGKKLSDHERWDDPIYELIVGEVGERLRGAQDLQKLL